MPLSMVSLQLVTKCLMFWTLGLEASTVTVQKPSEKQPTGHVLRIPQEPVEPYTGASSNLT